MLHLLDRLATLAACVDADGRRVPREQKQRTWCGDYLALDARNVTDDPGRATCHGCLRRFDRG